MNTLVPTVNGTTFEDFIEACAGFNVTYTFSVYSPTVTELTEFMNKRYGINNIDFKKSKFYDVETNTIIIPEHGGHWNFPALVSEQYNESTKQSTIIIDYYADCTYLVKAKTMKYIVQGKTADDFKLLSTELIYDSGFNPASGCV